MVAEVRKALRVEPGGALLDPRATPVGPRSKVEARDAMDALADRLDDLQEGLYAEQGRSVLLVLQGMDTSGKGGVIRHAAGLVNPQGLHIASFKKPTEEERRHHFLWRIERQVPAPGMIGVFDRSHYEDVLIVRVENLVPEDEWRGRYDEINDFEARLHERDVALVKCFLHISRDEQRERLLARLDNPAKRWKYNPGDLDVRAKWDDYQRAYADVLARCSTAGAPWYVVPGDRKWYRNWAVAALLAEVLADPVPRFPEPDFDVEAERARLLATP